MKGRYSLSPHEVPRAWKKSRKYIFRGKRDFSWSWKIKVFCDNRRMKGEFLKKRKEKERTLPKWQNAYASLLADGETGAGRVKNNKGMIAWKLLCGGGRGKMKNEKQLASELVSSVGWKPTSVVSQKQSLVFRKPRGGKKCILRNNQLWQRRLRGCVIQVLRTDHWIWQDVNH